MDQKDKRGVFYWLGRAYIKSPPVFLAVVISLVGGAYIYNSYSTAREHERLKLETERLEIQRKADEIERLKAEKKKEEEDRIADQARKEKEERAAAEKIARDEREAAEMAENEAKFPWIKSQKQLCNDYKAAPNEIKMFKIAAQVEPLLENSTVQNAVGTLKGMRTLGIGSGVFVRIAVGKEIEFQNLGFGIQEQSKVYKQLENLNVNSCVVFSTSRLAPLSHWEKSKVCDLEYLTEFTNITPCR